MVIIIVVIVVNSIAIVLVSSNPTINTANSSNTINAVIIINSSNIFNDQREGHDIFAGILTPAATSVTPAITTASTQGSKQAHHVHGIKTETVQSAFDIIVTATTTIFFFFFFVHTNPRTVTARVGIAWKDHFDRVRRIASWQ